MAGLAGQFTWGITCVFPSQAGISGGLPHPLGTAEVWMTHLAFSQMDPRREWDLSVRMEFVCPSPEAPVPVSLVPAASSGSRWRCWSLELVSKLTHSGSHRLWAAAGGGGVGIDVKIGLGDERRKKTLSASLRVWLQAGGVGRVQNPRFSGFIQG